MSSKQINSTSDLRSSAQDYKRDAARKHKWALGSVAPQGRSEDHPRPHRPSDAILSYNRRLAKADMSAVSSSGKAKLARKRDMLEAGDEYPSLSTSDESSTSTDEEIDAGVVNALAGEDVVYGASVAHGPSQGSQILNVALAKAIKKYEDKETTTLVRSEYDVVNDDGESLGLTPVKKARGKGEAIAAEDEDYEFV